LLHIFNYGTDPSFKIIKYENLRYTNSTIHYFQVKYLMVYNDVNTFFYFSIFDF